MSLKPGWYPQDDGTSRYWDGEQWMDGPPAAGGDPQSNNPASAGEVSKQTSQTPNGCIWGVGIVVVIFIIAGFASCGGSNDKGPDEYDTQATCKDIVRKQLKNPSTADFSGEAQSSVGASGMVVAENALGGKVTYSYRCSLSGDTVTLDSLTPR